MKMNKWLSGAAFIGVALIAGSCATTTHPNEQILVGNWRPEKVERIISPEEQQKIDAQKTEQSKQQAKTGTTTTTTSQTQTGSTTKQSANGSKSPVNVPRTSQPGTTTDQNAQKTTTEPARTDASLNVTKQQAGIDNLIRAEQRADLRITADKYVVKNYPGNTVKATWKLKGNGTILVAKNMKTKEKFKLDLLEVSPTRVVVQENLPNATLKITYVKVP
jgi:hypothetical protein